MMDDPTVLKNIVDGNSLPNSPQHQLFTDIEFRIAPGLELGVSLESLSAWYIDGANVAPEAADGYALLHARIRYEFTVAGLRTDLGVFARNLTDKEYIAFTEPYPGGNAYQAGSRREGFVHLKIHI